jgi:hypothetical protein
MDFKRVSNLIKHLHSNKPEAPRKHSTILECNVCGNFDLARLQDRRRSTPTLVEVRKAESLGCNTCAIINKAITHFGLVPAALGRDREWIPGKPFDYTDEEGFRRTSVDPSTLSVIIEIDSPDFRKETSRRLYSAYEGIKDGLHKLFGYILLRVHPSIPYMNREKAYLMEVSSLSCKALGTSCHINQRQLAEVYGETIRKWIQDCT